VVFDLNKCVNYITANKTKKISEVFGDWLKDYDITRIQWIALYFISTRDNLTQRDLANLMAINDSSVMRLIDRLERDGLVERVKTLNDRRKTSLILSIKGSELMDKVIHFGEDFNAVLTRNINPSDLDTFLKVQNQMLENVLNDKGSKK